MTHVHIVQTTRVTVNEPSDEFDLQAWLFALSDADYQACASGHQGAGVFDDEQGRGMLNVDSIGGHLIVQHYRCVRADRRTVEMYSPASRVYLFHLIPVPAGVRWTLGVTPMGFYAPEFACTVEVHLRPVLGFPGRLSFLGQFLANHVDEEAHGFAADMTRKIERTSHALQRDRQDENPTELRSRQQPSLG